MCNLAIEKVKSASWKPPFKSKYTVFGKKFDKLYELDDQVAKFNELFGENQEYVTKKVENKERNVETDNMDVDNFYVPCYLTPPDDFATKKEQECANFYQNSFCGKKCIYTKKSNWASIVEEYPRLMSKHLKRPIRVYTFPLKQLTIPKQDKEKKVNVKMFLGDDIIEIPELTVKLVVDEQNKTAVAFITANDNNMNDYQIRKLNNMCDSVCPAIGVDFEVDEADKEQKKAQMNRAGRTICCDYFGLLHHAQFLPVDLPEKAGLLVNPEMVAAYNQKQENAELERKFSGSSIAMPVGRRRSSLQELDTPTPSSSSGFRRLKTIKSDREGNEIEFYKTKILGELNKKSHDSSLIFSGESCINGQGNLYKALVFECYIKYFEKLKI